MLLKKDPLEWHMPLKMVWEVAKGSGICHTTWPKNGTQNVAYATHKMGGICHSNKDLEYRCVWN